MMCAVRDYRLWWVVLSLAAVAPFALFRYPPLYDYYNWAFQGRLISDLLFATGPDRAQVEALYGLRLQPVPNLAAPIGMAVLNLVWGPVEAARAFVAFTVLAFCFGYGYLVRSVHKRPSALELLGFAWALGYFVSRGYVSFLLSLALAFVLLARIFVIAGVPTKRVSPADLAALVAGGVLVYMCHLFGWLIAMMGLGIGILWLAWCGNRRDALAVAATAVPSVVLLAWYTLARNGPTHAPIYGSLLREKVLSLEPLLLLFRIDPFQPSIPTGWANLAAGALLIAAIAVNIRRPVLAEVSRPLVVMAGLLWLGYLLLPFAELGSTELDSIIKPDERFTLPALLVSLTLFPSRPIGTWRSGMVLCAALVVLLWHFGEYQQFTRLADRIEQTTESQIPPGARAMSITVHESATNGACTPSIGPSVGPPTLKWFGQVRLMNTRSVRTDLLATGILYPKYAADERDLAVLKVTPDEVRTGAIASNQAMTYEFIQAFGCPADLEAVARALGPNYRPVSSPAGMALFQRQDSSTP